MNKEGSFAIGIAGDSGSGKTVLVSTIQKVLGSDKTVILDGDGDHKWERGDLRWNEFTHLNPEANNLSKQSKDLYDLKHGKTILRSEYDHDSGKFTKPKIVLPKEYIILCGLHSLYLPETRNSLDLMIYMDIDESLRRAWKIQRDVYERGHSEDKVIQEIKKRIPDAGRYVYPQREYADISIRYFCEATDKSHDNLFFQVSAYSHVDFIAIEKCLRPYNVDIDYFYDAYHGRNNIAVYGASMESREVFLNEITEPLGIKYIEVKNKKIDLLHGILLMFIFDAINNRMGKSDE